MVGALRFYDEGDGGGAGGGGGSGGGGAPAEKMIPKSRFDAVNNELKALKAKAADVEASTKELEKLRAERDAWKAERATLTERATLARAGVVDDEHESALRAAFGGLAEEGRPESAAAYWSALLEKPIEEWPRGLRGFATGAPAAGAGGAVGGAGGADPAKKPAPQRLPAGGASPTGANHIDAAVRALSAANEAFAANRTPENHKRVQEAHKALSDLQAASQTPGR